MAKAAQLQGASALLEREHEVATIHALIEEARERGGRLLVIEGRAGMGKTRLLGEAREEAEAAGLEVLAARGGELEQEFAFGVVRQLFEPRLAYASAEERREFTSGAASLALPLFDESKLGSQEGAAADTSFAMLHGLYWLAANIALRRPALIAFDDLHWADGPSLRWVAYLVRRLEGLPLLVVVATRPPEQSRESALLTEVVSDPAAVVIRLGPLGTAAVAALVRKAFPADPDPEFVAACEAATGGNPLFLRALLDALVRERVPPTAAEAARVYETGPEALSRAISLRLARLPPEASLLVCAAAVLGDGTGLRDAAALAGLDAAAAARAATMLVRSDLLRQEDPVEFVHPIVRTAAYEEMRADDRTSAHRRAGELLLRAGAPPEQAAAHLALVLPAGDRFVAAALRAAGEAALARGAPQSAVSYLRRALEEPPADEERAELLFALGSAQFYSALPGAVEHLAEAFASVDDPLRRAEIALPYALALVFVNRWTVAVEVLHEAIDDLGGRQPPVSELLEAVLLTFAIHEPALNQAAVERIARVREDELHAGVGAAVMRAVLAFHEARVGASRERTVALAERALEDHRVVRSSQVFFAIQAIVALTVAGEVDKASRAYDDALADARRRGDLLSVHTLLLFRGFLAAQRGDLLSAEDDLRSAELDPAHQAALSLYRAGYLAHVLVERGQVDEAAHVLDSVPLGEEVHSGHRLYYLDARGRVELASARQREALNEFRRLGEEMGALGIENPAIVPWRSQAALTLHLLARTTEATELAREEVELARRWGAPRTVGISLRALALLTDGPEGEALLREAVDVLDRSPARLEHARAIVDLGAALRRRNQRGEARELVRKGLEVAHRAGATPLVSRAQEELAAMGARPRKLVVTGIDALTASERRVARMAAEGMSNKEIAQALFVTVKAVEVHLSSAYRKLGIDSRRRLPEALGELAGETTAQAV